VKTSGNGSSFFTPEQLKELEHWKGFYPHPQMGVLEALRRVQEWHRCVPLEAEPELAKLFALPVKAIHEVVTFYPYFTTKPTGKYRVGVCRNLSCTLAGAGKVLGAVEAKLGISEHETTKDGLFSFEAVECLGACDHAPAWAVGDELCGKADPATIGKTLDFIGKGGALPTPHEAYVETTGPEDKRLLTKHFEDRTLPSIETYKKYGGYKALEKARTMTPAAIQEEAKKSNLRGLGGAGFPTAFKWSTVPPKEKLNKPHYIVVNFDESEPGCFKDRVLVHRSPHLLIEGIMIAARAVDADNVIVFIRGEYQQQYRILEKALGEARKAGLLKPDIQLMRGASAYISGADSALLESVEGKKAWPRQYPPFPTVSGVMGCPTVVNNVETLCMMVPIIELGGEAFAKMGIGKSGGTAVYSISGHIERPGIYEFPMGTPLDKILEAAGGVAKGEKLKAVIPGGTSTPPLTVPETTVPMEFDSLRTVGSFLGAGGIIALNDTVDMSEVLYIIQRFLHHESCGQCTPCREGAGWSERILHRIQMGSGVPEDLPNLNRIGGNIMGKVICALGDTVGMASMAYLKKFGADFEARLSKKAVHG
jgi:NADH:ubiquinone oxidoreductase subunit F (NADH-binding)/NADH:ubiquinone oxidoreductase subunit E